MAGKILLVLVVILSVALTTEAGKAWWFGSNPGLSKGRRDALPDQNGSVDGKFFVFQFCSTSTNRTMESCSMSKFVNNPTHN